MEKQELVGRHGVRWLQTHFLARVGSQNGGQINRAAFLWPVLILLAERLLLVEA